MLTIHFAKEKKKMDKAKASQEGKEPAPAKRKVDSDSEEVSSEDEEDDDLVLEGVLVRNPEVSSSSDEDDEEEDDEDGEADKGTKEKPTNGNSKKAAAVAKKPPSRKRKKPKTAEPEIIQVEFTFHDMNEKFFHGLKTLIHSSSTVYAPHSSALSDLMIENISVGTVVSTEGDEDGNVFGFASVLNVSTYGEKDCIKHLKALCLKNCPEEHKGEMETVLSGKTKRPAGFLLHSRMVNLPLEIVEVLHKQLVMDMDWAVENAEGGEEERKSLDFGAFVRLAPAYPGEGSTPMYKYFDDEIFATNAEFCYTIDALRVFGSETKQLCSIIVMTKTGHRAAMQDMAKLVGGTPT